MKNLINTLEVKTLLAEKEAKEEEEYYNSLILRELEEEEKYNSGLYLPKDIYFNE